MTARVPARSGWCLVSDHRHCAYSPCACDCHSGNQAGSDRSTMEGHKAAPVASGGLTTNPTQAERRLGSW